MVAKERKQCGQTASSSWESDGWGNQGSDWEADGSWGGGDEYGESYTKHTGRLQVKKGFNHAILRGYADPEGTVLYSSDWGGDLEMLKTVVPGQLLDTRKFKCASKSIRGSFLRGRQLEVDV